MTSRFLTPLVLEDDRGFPMTLWLPLRYESELLQCEIVVPAGFKTDLASIPRGLWNVLPKVGPWDKAGVVHDDLYATGAVTVDGLAIPVPRVVADAVLSEALQVCGVSGWRLHAIIWGVRLGGWVAWRRYRKAQAQRT